MQIKASIGFPTLGELFKFTYDAVGVLPRKRGISGEMDETEKKSLQKALSRLANEEGDINENFGNLIQKLAFLVAGHITNPRVSMSIGKVLMDALEVYREVLKDEGTFLDKKATIKWFLSDYAIGRLVFSVQKHMLSFNVSSENFLTPIGFWFLPSITEDKVITPLEKVMQWIYDECGLTQKNFHYSDKSDSANHEQQEQNLENARKWLKGENLPSLSALLWNFNFSLELLGNERNSDAKINITNHLVESFCIALFIARVSTYVCNAILENFGLAYLKEVCEQYQCQTQYVTKDFREFKTSLENYMQRMPFSSDTIDEICFSTTTQFCRDFSEKQSYVARLLRTRSHQEQEELLQNPEQLENLIKDFGALSIHLLVSKINKSNSVEIPQNFPELLLNGLALKNNPLVSEEQIHSFELAIQESETEHLLPWILPWIKGAYHYRREEYTLAFSWLKEAFNKAKYCAGHQQYKLVNQFIELAAKNDKRREFNKGIWWAQYLEIDVRWLRQDEPTDEKLDFVFEIIKKAQYGSL